MASIIQEYTTEIPQEHWGNPFVKRFCYLTGFHPNKKRSLKFKTSSVDDGYVSVNRIMTKKIIYQITGNYHKEVYLWSDQKIEEIDKLFKTIEKITCARLDYEWSPGGMPEDY